MKNPFMRVTLRRSWMRTTILIAVLTCIPASWLSTALAAEHASEPKAETRVDVVVRDRHGRIVRNLEPADFAITDGAAKLAVVEAKLVEGGDPATRLVSLVFQQMRGESAEISRDTALAAVAGAHGKVNFAVFLIDEKLSLLQPFTTNPKAVRAAVERATGKKAKGAAPHAEASTKELAETVDRILRTADQLASGSKAPASFSSLLAVARGQAREPGRKAVVYFSEGLPIADTNDEAFRTIVSAANLQCQPLHRGCERFGDLERRRHRAGTDVAIAATTCHHDGRGICVGSRILRHGEHCERHAPEKRTPHSAGLGGVGK